MDNEQNMESRFFIPIGINPDLKKFEMNYYPSEYGDEKLVSPHSLEEGMNKYEIWMQGYMATGEHGLASCVGISYGFDFADAVRRFQYPKDIVDRYSGEVQHHKGDHLKFDERGDYLSIWGCRLFDNEKDSRKAFG